MAVDVPLAPPRSDGIGDLPLLLGAYVAVEIRGPGLEGVVSIPRRALREDDRVWVNRGGELVVAPVEVAWSVGDRVFVRGGPEPGEEVVVSRIAAPVPGMALAVNGDGRSDASASDTAAAAPGTAPAGAIPAGAR